MLSKSFYRLPLAAVLAGFVASLAVAENNPASPDLDETPATAAPTEIEESASQVPAASMVVARDPVTGRLHPASAEQIKNLLTEDMRKSLSTSTVDLVEVESPTPGGGVMLDLKGRFRNYHFATKDDAGNLRIRCQSGDATSHDDSHAHASRTHEDGS